MGKVVALDCTLRDGGYCNKWRFGEKNIKKIISNLISARLDVIECGFLTNRVEYDKDVSKFTDVRQLDEIIPNHGDSIKFVLMVNMGEYDFEELPDRCNSSIDGIRIAFHKSTRYEAINACKILKQKGYLVFIQPMVTMLYTDEEFCELVELANSVEPYAFYLVDSFGMMNKRQVIHYWEILDNKLDSKVLLGFHAHNNLQLAYANAISLLERDANHKLIIDSSVYGMGRGAGNLNSELFLAELNNEFDGKYEIKPLLKVMDEVINRFYEEKPWGYSLPNYLSASHMIHPNYAGYLAEKRTLTVEDVDEIFSQITPDKGSEYDEAYIGELYIQYMSTGVIRNGHLKEIQKKSQGRDILIIAPGKNAIVEKTKILSFIEEANPLIISVNHEYPLASTDYIFVSNIRRFSEIDDSLYYKTISTSNIKSAYTYASIDYYSLLNASDVVRDNAGLMAIKFAIDELSAKDVYLAGLDGYSQDIHLNYEDAEKELQMSVDFMERVNQGIQEVILDLSKNINVHFITTSMFRV